MKRIVIKKEIGRVRYEPVSARKLMILEVGHKFKSVTGAIVWAKPQKGDTPEVVADYVEKLRKAGAEVVLSMPMAAENSAVPRDVHDQEVGEGLGVRAVVESLLAKVKEMTERVRAITETAMAKAGL